jgi:hypothetical protein
MDYRSRILSTSQNPPGLVFPEAYCYIQRTLYIKVVHHLDSRIRRVLLAQVLQKKLDCSEDPDTGSLLKLPSERTYYRTECTMLLEFPRLPRASRHFTY